MPIITLPDLKTLAEICALAVGGVWAIYGFIVLQQREKAAAELRKINLEAQKTEQEIRRVPVIRADISATTTATGANEGHLLLAEVTLANEGKRDTCLRWNGEPPAFAIRRVVFDENGIPTFPDKPIQVTVRKARDPNAEAVSHIVRAGASQCLAFAAHLSQPGVYLLSFRAAVAPDDIATSVEAGASCNHGAAWTVTKYIVVGNGRFDG